MLRILLHMFAHHATTAACPAAALLAQGPLATVEPTLRSPLNLSIHAHFHHSPILLPSPCLLARRCSHPAVLAHLRSSGERLLLLGHRSKRETVVIPADVQDVVVVLESLPYTVRCCHCLPVGAGAGVRMCGAWCMCHKMLLPAVGSWCVTLATPQPCHAPLPCTLFHCPLQEQA